MDGWKNVWTVHIFKVVAMELNFTFHIPGSMSPGGAFYDAAHTLSLLK